MKLIAGLGNPGYEYYLTPHNLGFMAVDRLAEKAGVEISRPDSQALIARASIGGVETLLAKPQTYVNLSGLAIGRLFEKYALSADDLIVLSDDADLPLGTLRIRARGSAGGHNGLKSIIGVIAADEFVRIRMGINPDRAVSDLADYVLSRFRKSSLESVAEMIERAAEAAEVILREGIQTAMNRFNRRASS